MTIITTNVATPRLLCSNDSREDGNLHRHILSISGEGHLGVIYKAQAHR